MLPRPVDYTEVFLFFIKYFSEKEGFLISTIVYNK